MTSVELARALRDSGLEWRPAAGDAFVLDLVEADDQVFFLSELTVETHHYPTGTVLGFNGTTEWALDSVDIGDALWLPHEHQLRELLGAAFVTLAATSEAGFTVVARIDDIAHTFEADDAANAYARALLALLDSLAT